MEQNDRKTITMNSGYVLIKRDNATSRIGGLTMPDTAGNAIKGIIIETSAPDTFKLGAIAYCANGVEVKVNGEAFTVVKFENVFFTLS